jgi:hypothetical protein
MSLDHSMNVHYSKSNSNISEFQYNETINQSQTYEKITEPEFIHDLSMASQRNPMLENSKPGLKEDQKLGSGNSNNLGSPSLMKKAVSKNELEVDLSHTSDPPAKKITFGSGDLDNFGNVRTALGLPGVSNNDLGMQDIKD